MPSPKMRRIARLYWSFKRRKAYREANRKWPSLLDQGTQAVQEPPPWQSAPETKEPKA